MRISILLPYKENFTPIYAGAVSLFVKDTTKLSKFKKFITVYGNTNLKNIYKLSYKNIKLSKNLIQSGSKIYVDEGASSRRFRARARGRSASIIKRSCHITVEVGGKE